MATSWDFTTDDVDDAIDFVIHNGAEDRGQTLSYSRVFEAAGLPPPQELHQGGESQLVTAFMEQFHHRCAQRSLPPLDSLVVHVASSREGRPGGGYFRVNGFRDPFGERATAEQVIAAYNFWEGQVEECRRWGTQHRRES